ncbi:MAG: hypothetical protein IT186_22335 [Acidobacteria bacterium]|nr:hypothetical protein [Acidobacteriota bacterium]MCG3191517.1 hypothetical protein [Thermoanaerobaculia bacterium]MCK6681165.1 hypothetical protein [Thermoanaerobaculia bacterium]
MEAADLSKSIEVICRLAERAHARFDSGKWRASPGSHVVLSNGQTASPSYHNEHHVRAVTSCARAVFAKRESSDPFNLNGQLACWNAGQADASMSVDPLLLEFSLVAAFAGHDIGNISSPGAVSISGNSDEHLHFPEAAHYDSSTLYLRPEVEIRSADITARILDEVLTDPSTARRVQPLIQHLILQTVFHFEKVSSDELFWLFMQTVDMVGSYFFSPVPRRVAVAGLFNEMRVQKPGTISIYPFLTSLHYRFQRLVPDPAAQEAVLAIFETNPYGQTREKVFASPPQRSDLLAPLPFEDAIRILLEDHTLEHSA